MITACRFLQDYFFIFWQYNKNSTAAEVKQKRIAGQVLVGYFLPATIVLFAEPSREIGINKG